MWPGLTALVGCLLWTVVESRRLGLPAAFEDAAMLFRYAEQLADGWGVTWNAGEAPGLTDGATDLGFVLALGLLSSLGLPTVVGALLVNLLAVFGMGALFGVLNTVWWRRSQWLPVGLAALVAAGPVNRYVLSGFSPPALAFLLLGAFTLAVAAVAAPHRRVRLLLFAGAGAAAAVAGWWRPEGFAFGPFVVLFGVLAAAGAGRLRSGATWTALVAPYLALAAGWAALRIGYFGHLLPTSAVMKAGSLHVANAVFSLQFYASLLLPLIGVVVVATLGRGRARNWWIVAVVLTTPLLWANTALPQGFWDRIGVAFVPAYSDVATVALLVPALLALVVVGIKRRDGSWLFPVALLGLSVPWIALATTLNWWGRMQWPLVPVLAALAGAQIVRAAGKPGPRAERPSIAAFALLACVGILPFHLPIGSYFESPFQTSVAAALKTVDTSGVRIATTEAGLIPLAVTGPALDTYGHNNRSIAASRGATLAEQLTAFGPNVLAIHGLPPTAIRLDDCSAQQERDSTTFTPRWSAMVSELYEYADRNGLTLTRISETTPCETWSLLVSDDVDPTVRRVLDQLRMPGTEVGVGSR